MILTLDGAVATNPHNGSHLLVTCPTVPDSIIFCEFGDGQTPYQGYGTGFDVSDGRSLLGIIRRKGNNYPVKKRLELAFQASDLMLSAFEAVLDAQRQDQVATVVDAWNAPVITQLMWLDVTDRYRTQISTNLHLLQFSAWEV
jgi:hypothetical protein